MQQESFTKATFPEEAGRLLATEMPTLWPSMLIPRPLHPPLPFPFGEERVHYCYFARNGIYALARHLLLSGQEILFPAYFHGVELEALQAAGVRPRFYPVRRGMRIDPEEVAGMVRPGTRAIYLIHYLGFPGPVRELAEVCRRRGILLIEDCALSLLSCLRERPLGSFGDAAVFCLYKTLPTPNGGAILLKGDRLLAGEESPSLSSTAALLASSLLRNLEVRSTLGRRIRQASRALGNRASSAAGLTRVPVGTEHFDPAYAGLRMSGLSHLVLASQDFAGIVRARRRNYLQLRDGLADLAPPLFTDLPPGVCPLFYPLLTPAKRELFAYLRARGIEGVDFWGARRAAVPEGMFPDVDELRRGVLEIPCHQDLSEEALRRIIKTLRALL